MGVRRRARCALYYLIVWHRPGSCKVYATTRTLVHIPHAHIVAKGKNDALQMVESPCYAITVPRPRKSGRGGTGPKEKEYAAHGLGRREAGEGACCWNASDWNPRQDEGSPAGGGGSIWLGRECSSSWWLDSSVPIPSSLLRWR